jgi:aminoglycoside 6-adenylyltransferase
MRGDLWAVKFRDADIKHRLLLKLIQWHESSKKHWKLHALPNGHGMKKWASPRVWNWAHRLFPPFEHEASWRGLIQTIVFFRECAEELSNKLGYRYPAELDRHFTGYLLHLMNQKKSFARKDS